MMDPTRLAAIKALNPTPGPLEFYDAKIMTACHTPDEDRVREILIEQLGVPATEITNPALLVDDLGCDSLDIVELMSAAEDAFDIDIPDEAIDKVRTVGDAIELVKGLKG